MKRTIVLALSVLCYNFLHAQDEGQMQLYAMQNKWEDAKTDIDKAVNNPKLKDKDKPKTLGYEAYIYGHLYADSAYQGKYPDADETVKSAMIQAKTLEPDLKKFKEGNGPAGIGMVYSKSFDKGKNFFQEKKWDSSFKYFSQAYQMSNFINDNGLGTNKITIDTTTTLFSGYAAQNANMSDSAVVYYKKIADLKIGQNDYESYGVVYTYLLDYYQKKKDDASFKALLPVAKQLFPDKTDVWTQFEMGSVTSGVALPDLLAKYKQESAAGPMNEQKYLSYGEAMAITDKTQLEKVDSATQVQLKLAAADAFSKAFALNDTAGLYAFNVGVIYYGIYQTLDDRYSNYRGEGADLKTKRAEVEKQEMMYADSAIVWLEKAYPVLKNKTTRSNSEKISLNRLVDYLANTYYWKRDKMKTVKPADYDKYDALYKQYDAEHNKYQ